MAVHRGQARLPTGGAAQPPSFFTRGFFILRVGSRSPRGSRAKLSFALGFGRQHSKFDVVATRVLRAIA